LGKIGVGGIFGGPAADGVHGEGTNGVYGVSFADYGSGSAPEGAGVWGANKGGGPGVYGTSASGDGILGQAYHGVHGQSSNSGGSGVWGENTGGGAGVSGISVGGDGVHGESQSGQHAGVSGVNTSGSTTAGPGVYGLSSGWHGVNGESQSRQHAGVFARNTGNGYGVWATGNPAGYFQGDVHVTGDLILVNSSGDLAEDLRSKTVPCTKNQAPF
jgi:hypothetical protein